MKTFEKFIQSKATKGILYIETDESPYTENWTMEIDIENIWQDYTNKKISLVDFNNQYASLLMEQQQNISEKVGDSCWYDIEPIIVEELRSATTTDKSETAYDKLYDIFNKYDIYLNTGKVKTQ